MIVSTVFCLCTDGTGSSSKSAEVFTEEEQFFVYTLMVWVLPVRVQRFLQKRNKKACGRKVRWGAGIQKLLCTVFFLKSKKFCLIGGEEHQTLKLSQVERFSDPDHYKYTGMFQKNRTGRLRQLQVTSCPGLFCTRSRRCCVLDLYLSKLPLDASECDVFYLTPLASIPKDAIKPWFLPISVGCNTLSTMVHGICSDGNI